LSEGEDDEQRGREVKKGRVAFATAENPDDLRMRFMVACQRSCCTSTRPSRWKSGASSPSGDDEIDSLRHQPGDKGHVAAQPIELGDDDRAVEPLAVRERGAKLGALSERVRALISVA
jgi:hypothetical protein